MPETSVAATTAPESTTAAAGSPAPAAAPSLNWDNFKITDDQFKAAGFDSPEKLPVVPVEPSAKEPEALPAASEPADALNLDLLGKEPEIAPAPTLSPDHQTILKMFPNADMASMGAQGLQLTNAFIKGDVDTFLTSLAQLNPQAFSHLQESLYQKLMPSWTDRYIAENDANANPQQTALRQRLETMERHLTARAQAEQQMALQADHQRRLANIDTEIDKLFNLVHFTNDTYDRDMVTKLIHHDLANNPQVFQDVWQGNMPALRPLFGTTVNRYVERDRLRTEKLRTAAQTQEQVKKPPLQSAGVGSDGGGKKDYFKDAAEFVANH